MIVKTMPKNSTSSKPSIGLSVVIPTYNSGAWLPKIISKLATSVKKAGLEKVEIIVVNDGSTDDTAAIAQSLQVGFPIKVISQPNGGRFLARHNGALAARYEYILFIDTRVFLGEDSLNYLLSRLNKAEDRVVWSSHVLIDRKGNPYARFWEAITFIAWRKYFGNPRDYSYGLEEFDYYPKGTTCFFAPKKIILEANEWFEKNTKNKRASNDDTLLIRHIAKNHTINLSPKFNCTYHGRTGAKQFAKHVYYRGKFFVDGFLRRDGNRFFWPLIGFLILSVATPVFLVLFPQYILAFLGLVVVGWVGVLVAALSFRVQAKDALSLFVLSPLFLLLYGIGIWSAVIDIYVRRARPA